MDEKQLEELIKNVDKSVNTMAKVRLVRQALKQSRFVPVARKQLTPEARKVIEDFLDKKEKEIKEKNA